MRAFPYDLMYFNQERGRVGLSRFSDTFGVNKLAELLRAYRRGDEMAAAAKRVIKRTLRAQDLYLQESEKVNIHQVKRNQHWFRRTLKWLQNTTSIYGVVEWKKTQQDITQASVERFRACHERCSNDWRRTR